VIRLLVPEIFEKASKLRSKQEKIDFLRKHKCAPLLDVIRINFDDDIVSLLPVGEPPYKKDDAPVGHSRSTLYLNYKKFTYFFKGGKGTNMSQAKRELMFINLLESLHHEEAAMVVLAKDKKMKYNGITKNLCQEAFPGLIKK
jgi:hypothetical protein